MQNMEETCVLKNFSSKVNVNLFDIYSYVLTCLPDELFIDVIV